jgi:hypothetical protein
MLIAYYDDVNPLSSEVKKLDIIIIQFNFNWYW